MESRDVNVRYVHGSEIFRTVRVLLEIPAFEPVRTCSEHVRTVRTVRTVWTVRTFRTVQTVPTIHAVLKMAVILNFLNKILGFATILTY